MRTLKNRRALIYSAVCVFLALFFQCSYLGQREKQLQGEYEPIPILVAAQDIPKDFRLDQSMVQTRSVPKKYIQPKALRKPEEVLGQISSGTIFKGEQILATKLLSIEDAGLAFKIPKDQRAFTIAVDAIKGVGGHIRPGNYVDVMGIFDFGDATHPDQRAVTLLQDVLVLAAGSDLGQAVPINVSETGSILKKAIVADGQKYIYRDITLQLSPEQAQRIMLAQEMGGLNLTLRSLWEGDTRVALEKVDVRATIGIPEKVYRRPRAEYREIRAGGY